MVNKITVWGFFFISISLASYAQPVIKSEQPSTAKQITMQDLKPKINYSNSDPFYQPVREKAGLALLSSAIIPGSGQAANKKWIRAGAYLLADAVLLGIHFKKINDAQRQQRRYNQFANNNWSVVSYAKWLVNYHDQNPQLQNPHINDLRNQISGITPSYSTQDWQKVDLELLRQVERNTRFVYPDNEVGNTFSHVTPDYGSQQYYELISKYYQFGSGWKGFGTNINSKYQLPWDGSAMPMDFVRGSQLAENFNDSYRIAGNMISLLLINHFLSAFDAFLTVKLKNARLETNTNLMNPQETFSVKFHF